MGHVRAKKELALLIPTKNRKESLEYYLESKGERFAYYGIDIVVYDSSDNDDTSQFIKQYSKQHDKVKLIYHRVQDSDRYGTQKTNIALKETANEYQYVWLCGDQAIIDIDVCFGKLKSCMDQKYDVIHIYDKDVGITNRAYEDENEFFSVFFWSMTHWCAFVLSSKFVLELDPYIDDYMKSGGMNPLVFSIFSLLKEKKFKIYYIYVNSFISNPPMRNLSYSHQMKDMMNGWIKMIYHGFNYLPKTYDEAKPAALEGVKENVRILSYPGAVLLRATGNINFSNVNKNIDAVKYLASCSICWIEFLCIMPVWFSRLLNGFINVLRKIKRILIRAYSK